MKLSGQINLFDMVTDSGEPCNHYDRILLESPTPEIMASFVKMFPKIRGYGDEPTKYQNIMVSISGGWDSDIIMDMIERVGYKAGSVKYVFFNTGMEYQATLEHLDYLERHYGVKIHRERAVVPVPKGCREHGVPFLSKRVSQNIHALQINGFDWTEKSFDELSNRYKCKAAVAWWCNTDKPPYSISRYPGLKEFMIKHPPDFAISDWCCTGAKKKTSERLKQKYSPDLEVLGVRKGEGGIRATAYHSCFSEKSSGADSYRPLFWWKKEDKLSYDAKFALRHSDCYEKYGFRRTGCAACPFGTDFEKKLEAARIHEPKLYRLANAVFGKSYEYTRQYLAFRKEMENETH